MSPVDLKTLAQFILLGDASIRCVPSADAGAKTASKFALMGISEGGSERLSRIERREQFARQAQMLQSTKAVSETVSRPVSPDVRRKLDQIREAMGLQKTTYASYGVKSGPETKRFGLGAAAVPQRNTPSAFHLVFEKSEIAESRATALRIIEVTEADGEFIRVRELFSR